MADASSTKFIGGHSLPLSWVGEGDIQRSVLHFFEEYVSEGKSDFHAPICQITHEPNRY